MATELVTGAVLPPPASAPEFRGSLLVCALQTWNPWGMGSAIPGVNNHPLSMMTINWWLSLYRNGIRKSGVSKSLWLLWGCDPVPLENISNHEATTKPKLTYPNIHIVLTTNIDIGINNYPYHPWLSIIIIPIHINDYPYHNLDIQRFNTYLS